jgi:hypothetical protein
MTALVFEADELLRSHEYASPHHEAGFELHGGFDAVGTYIPPRSLIREQAIDAWTQALVGRGGELLEADSSLLAGLRYPSPEQMKLLLQEGLGQTFWNSLTITGAIEGRGRILAELEFPDFGKVVREDVSEMAIGHLNKGLLRAHGLDEGGEPDRGIGGHDVMWYALRDLAFGKTDFPVPEVPENIGRPDSGVRKEPRISAPIEQALSMLLNLLLIEFRAERGFQLSETLLRDPELFQDRREEAGRAADMVERIRTDEEIHVTSLRLYLGELRSLHFRTQDGDNLLGAEIIDPIWAGLVHWATVEQPQQMAEQQREMLTSRILAHPEAERVLREFNAREEAS